MATNQTETTTSPEDVDAAIARAAKLGPEAAEAEAAKHKPKPAAKPAKRVSGRDAVAKVLADGKPRKAKEITAAAVKLVKPAMKGKTPEATLASLLYTGEFKLRPVKAAK